MDYRENKNERGARRRCSKRRTWVIVAGTVMLKKKEGELWVGRIEVSKEPVLGKREDKNEPGTRRRKWVLVAGTVMLQKVRGRIWEREGFK